MPDIALRLGRDMLTLEGDVADILHAQGIPEDECPEFSNVLDPELVADIHRYSHLVGATCAISNTWGGSRALLARHGLEDRLDELDRAGVRIAAQGAPQHVLAAMGPCGLTMAPRGTATFGEVFAQYFEQASALAKADPDALFIADMADIADARAAALAAHYACDLPVFVCCRFDAGGLMTESRTTPQAAAAILEGVGISAVGVCAANPDEGLSAVRLMASATRLPLIGYVDVGEPPVVAGRPVSPLSPDDAARWALAYRDAGVQMFGLRHGATYAQTGAIAVALDLLDVRAIEPVTTGAVLATPRTVIPLSEVVSAGGISILSVWDGVGGYPDDRPLSIRCADDEALEKALHAYPGRPLVDLSACDPGLLTDCLLLGYQYGALTAFPLDDGRTVADARTFLGRLGLSDRDVVLTEEGVLV